MTRKLGTFELPLQVELKIVFGNYILSLILPVSVTRSYPGFQSKIKSFT